MPAPKSPLAVAQTEDLGPVLSISPSKDQLRRLKVCLKKDPAAYRFRGDEAREIARELWLQATGVQVPAALTVETQRGRQLSLVLRELEMWHDPVGGWAILLDGLNILKTGATGKSSESARIEVCRPYRLAKRTLFGQWVPVLRQTQEVAC
jgi:hypothetical protein